MNQEKIFFITDSACDIPAKDEQELENLCILPIPVTADGKGYYERESFTPEEFYDLWATPLISPVKHRRRLWRK